MTPVPRTVLRLTAALACSAGLLVTAPGLASAAELVRTDPARDVVGVSMSSDKEQVAPGERGIDIRKVRASHGTDVLVIQLRTRGRLAHKGVILNAAVRTPGGSYDVTHLRFAGATESALTSGNAEVACPGFAVERGRRTATITIPTACIGDPAWVRVGVGIAQARGKRFYADDGLSRTVGNRLKLSGKIARG
ncbi:hypothetical protein KVF89_09660 [Nocardioides carbamazepini]|uniref:hypothetical protein n=1 Tax=Nocardioides carbamazepini TaxID=2854259 RepID=UPI00214A7225|nr:hypothetical protein [Nocardioides carbamazepini]MCR1782799.1 hypothetical protein [Nocardioides carbamazepini]